MPVLSKSGLSEMQRELSARYNRLYDLLEGRELRGPTEGCKRGHWVRPENKSATEGSGLEIRIAADDFKTILAEIKRIK